MSWEMGRDFRVWDSCRIWAVLLSKWEPRENVKRKKVKAVKKYLLYSLLSSKKYPCKTADQMRRLNWVIWKLKNTNAFNFGHKPNSRNHDHRLLPNSKKNVWNFLSSEFLHCNSRSPKRNRAPSCQMGNCLYYRCKLQMVSDEVQ